ncbi:MULTISPECIES: hypothetical protein [Pseudoalteromonas]|uniref:hypothetical protein n=1 Tax=Pseudoalteromonas TaxID=53246 RepID=UPI000C347A45|nr:MULTISPECIES: hypothetical protein [Pseudoalteromonas]PKG67840.1 hypothetical protein CXF75_02335 [Pseudoalteromonas arctica]PKG70863.1 hypothetical protein CXF64_08505 [Pseudoalteromonas sp. GutCa3]
MDIIISQHALKKKTQLTQLSERAIGKAFKDQAALAIQMTQCSAAVYRRLQRTYKSTVTPRDEKRVKAGGLSTQSVTFSTSNSSQKSFNSLLPAMRGRGAPTNTSKTSNDVAVASNQPQAVNLLALLHPVISGDIMKTGNAVEKTATILGLVTTTVGFVVPGGGAVSSIVSWVGSGATYSGFSMSRIRSDAPDRAYHQLTNYITWLAAWNKKACELIDIADPNGQWTFRDIEHGLS